MFLCFESLTPSSVAPFNFGKSYKETPAAAVARPTSFCLNAYL